MSWSCFFFYLIIFFGGLSVCQGSIGVCNGRRGNNLPSEQEVVDLYKTHGITKMRIYSPAQATLSALRRSGIELILDVPSGDLQSLQSDATSWVRTNILPYFPDTKIRYIAVGNEVDPAKPEHSRFVPLVLPAMKNLHKALSKLGLQDQIKVSTATYSGILMDTYPPSKSKFSHRSFMEPIIGFLAQTRAPLLANIYPYFAYIRDTKNIPLSYALFTAEGVVVKDDPYGYQNLFDAMVDGMYYAVEKAGGGGVEIVVSESGWPSDGGVAATVEYASSYYRKLIDHVKKGTPKKKKAIETYLFAMFDENQKEGDQTEQHFGLFYPNKALKYQVNFNA